MIMRTFTLILKVCIVANTYVLLLSKILNAVLSRVIFLLWGVAVKDLNTSSSLFVYLILGVWSCLYCILSIQKNYIIITDACKYQNNEMYFRIVQSTVLGQMYLVPFHHCWPHYTFLPSLRSTLFSNQKPLADYTNKGQVCQVVDTIKRDTTNTEQEPI